ncbi:hypothetical protein QO002_005444 [Pararhizobium capsulatum DSM 1112]|uniref:DUF982 domain-containing protein n=1 Tax=Pararhizobium capsulatum DSM 1112 TaxID=1121113 RepID=A0ABU0BY97_9HYPH|nr:DUF982 domain-containing protein [Pararhizobium capsulatum]MDQ0323238.1 hypothetical protein [Pararhizobium capsulatum DSM 1112]
MTKFHWKKPVKVASCDGREHVIPGPAEALQSLDRWLCREGWFYERARDSCHAALEKGQSTEDARRAFIAAALDMDIPFA